MNTAFKKRHGWAARWEGLNLHKGYTKYRHGSLPQSKLSRELAQASCNHEVPWDINAEPAVSLKAVDFRAKKNL